MPLGMPVGLDLYFLGSALYPTLPYRYTDHPNDFKLTMYFTHVAIMRIFLEGSASTY
jgi:hypothetical protein